MKQVTTVVAEFCEQSGRTPGELLVYLLDDLRVHHERLRAAPHSNLLSEVQILARADPTRGGIPRSTLDLLSRHVRVHNLDAPRDFQGEAAVLLRILQGCMGDAGPDGLRPTDGSDASEAPSPVRSLSIL